MDLQLTFSSLEALLARLHEIASDKRIAFQGRLKSYLRMAGLEGVRKGRGKAASYSAGDAVLMALAVEMAQLGLPPERIAHVLGADAFPIFAAVMRSVEALRSPQDDEQVILHFDPRGLAALADPVAQAIGTVDFGSSAFVQRHLAGWTRKRRRLSLLNVTAVIAEMADAFGEDRALFLDNAHRWARTGTAGFPGRETHPTWEEL